MFKTKKFYKEQISTLERDNDVLIKRNEILKRKVENREEKICELEKALNSSKNEVIQANTIIDSYAKTINNMQSDIILKTKEIEKLKIQVKLKEEKRRKNAGKIGGITKELKQTKTELSAAINTIKILNKEVSSLKARQKKTVKAYCQTKSERV